MEPLVFLCSGSYEIDPSDDEIDNDIRIKALVYYPFVIGY